MISYKIEYPIEAKVDDVLAWLEKDMRRIESYYYKGELRATFQCQRQFNSIKVSHTLYLPKVASESRDIKQAEKISGKHFQETDNALILPGDISFSFEVDRVTDTRSVIICQYAADNLHIEKLFYTYLARLGIVFNADFKESVAKELEEIELQEERELGGHWDWTEWHKGSTGNMERSYAFIQNAPKITSVNQADSNTTKDKTKKQKTNPKQVKVISERTEALNKLAKYWVEYNQNQRISKDDNMSWFLNENAKAVGLEFVSPDEFKRHLPKAYKAKIIDKDKNTRRFIPKLATPKKLKRNS